MFEGVLHTSLIVNLQSLSNKTSFNPISTNFTKWPNTQTIRRQFADELFECVWQFCQIDA